MRKISKKHYKLILGIVFAFLSAIFYSLNIPISKYYINKVTSNELLFLTYLGSSIGLLLVNIFHKKNEAKIKRDLKTEGIIILCDMFASQFIVLSLKFVNASTVSLLSLLETVFTLIISYLFFKNKINKNLILSAIFVTIGGLVLSINEIINFNISIYILLILIATILWGLENNLTPCVNQKNIPILIFYKCLTISLFNLLFFRKNTNLISLISNNYILLIIGFFSYGLSFLFYAYSTKKIGANKTAIIFSFSPFFSAILSFLLFKNHLSIAALISLFFMTIGVIYSIKEKK